MLKYYMSRRIYRHLWLIAVQTVLLAACQICAYWLRYDCTSDAFAHPRLWPNLGWTLLIQLFFIELFGLNRHRWRYVSVNDLISITGALVVSSAVIFALRLSVAGFGVPRGVIITNFGLAILALGFARVIARLVNERQRTPSKAVAERRVLIIGAGDSGALMARQILAHPELKMLPVAFLDDNPRLHGLRVHGVAVLGGIDDIPKVIEDVQANEVLISMPSASGGQTRRAVERVMELGLHVRIVPSIAQLVQGTSILDSVREVEVTDLLGREPVQIDQDAVSKLILGERVLVSGAGGSIGSELCRQILGFRPAALMLVDQAEPLLFATEQQLLRVRNEEPALRDTLIQPAIADITDQDRVEELVSRFKPELICHAAAHKHVPMMESNPGEAVKNNVFGTRTLAEAAVRNNVKMFVMVSTDKAINPTSVMGVTKRVAELYVQALSKRAQTTFVTVRFGNVLGSSGSVVPIFREQIRKGGPVTVTHPEMKRYFMLIPEAVQLILQAAVFGRGGQIFVLDMGEPIRIVDMARQLIRLSGLSPDVDIQIKYVGLRPGEKLFEELQLDGESVDKTPHPRIRVVKAVEASWEELLAQLERLQRALVSQSPAEIRASLRELVPEYAPPSSQEVLLTDKIPRS